MIWPFKKKPKPLKIDPGTQWAVGDLAVCVYKGKWSKCPGPIPVVDQIYPVTEVTTGTDETGTVDAVWLFLAGFPSTLGYRADCFRKVQRDNKPAEEEFCRAIDDICKGRVPVEMSCR